MKFAETIILKKVLVSYSSSKFHLNGESQSAKLLKKIIEVEINHSISPMLAVNSENAFFSH